MLKTGMSSSKSAPELSDKKPEPVQDDEIIKLDDTADEVVINDELTEKLSDEENDEEEPGKKPEEQDSEPGAENTKKPDGPPLDDPATDRAVEEIVAEESDVVLAAEDRARKEHDHPPGRKKASRQAGPFTANNVAEPKSPLVGYWRGHGSCTAYSFNSADPLFRT